MLLFSNETYNVKNLHNLKLFIYAYIISDTDDATTCPECHVSHVCRLIIRVVLRRYRELLTAFLAFTLQLIGGGGRKKTCCLKSFKLVWWCHLLLPWFLTNDLLLIVSHESHLSPNDKGDGTMPEAVQRFSVIYLATE